MTSVRRIGWLLCSLSIVAGCVQGPNYVKPSVAVPDAYRFGANPASTIDATAEAAWWSGYGDPYLDALVQEALANNRNLVIATARVDEFAAILAGTRSQAYPQVGYGLSGNRTRTSKEKLPAFVDPLMNMLVLAALYLAAVRSAYWSAAALGLAFATKQTALFAVPLGVLIFKERMGLAAAIGCALAIGGIICVSLG